MDEMLDYYCDKIFWLLVLKGEYRFNALHKTLNGIGVKISKPTLIVHLGHLQEKDFIVRIEEDKQNVSYQVNSRRFEYLKETAVYKELLLNLKKNKKVFQSLSPRDQLSTLVDITFLHAFHGVKKDLSIFLEPEKEVEYCLSFWFFLKSLDTYRLWFLDTFKKADENTRKLILEKIDGSIDMFTNEIFDVEKDKS